MNHKMTSLGAKLRTNYMLAMPIPRGLFRSLRKQHGSEKARAVLHAMEQKNSPRFRKTMGTAVRRGHVVGLRKAKNG